MKREDIIFPEDILKRVTPDNWERVWDGLMVDWDSEEGIEYFMYNTTFTKEFIKTVVSRIEKDLTGKK